MIPKPVWKVHTAGIDEIDNISTWDGVVRKKILKKYRKYKHVSVQMLNLKVMMISERKMAPV